MLGWNEIEDRAVAFQNYWKNCEGNERQEAQTFEKDFMNIFGIDWKDGFHEHQITLTDGSIGYIDYFLPGKVLIEMKSKGQSLAKAYTQAMSYVHSLKPEEVPVLVIVSDFEKMQVYNLEKDRIYKPFRISQLRKYVRVLGFLAGYNTRDKEETEIELDIDASYKMAKLHDALRENGYGGHRLEVYLVRLLFCLFAEDTGVFEKYSFRNYIENSMGDGSEISMRLMALFETLDTPEEKRMKTLTSELKKFRYINGSLFKDILPLASFDKNMKDILLDCCMFNWSAINPAIFGAIFQGVMDQNQRRSLGAHYTSEENIMKVLKPLFLDDLYKEFEKSKRTVKELEEFQDKLASLTFLDPACGSGNFLIIAYQKLRELEFEVMKMIYDRGQLALINRYTKVDINQFYGIEYEDFPTQIAKVSMILMKHLMDQRISNYFGFNLVDFPIRANVNIICTNALRMDWNELIKDEELHYIIGNPPFVGHQNRNNEQQKDMDIIFEDRGYKKLDYVCAWYKKAFDYIKSKNTHCAFVSTNSIVQGEQAILMTRLYNENNISINFSYRSFIWVNEAKYKAAVHCVIIGFSTFKHRKIAKTIYGNELQKEVLNINAYLLDAPDIMLKSRGKDRFQGIPYITKGSQPTDGGNLILTKKEYKDFLSKYPDKEFLFKKYVGAEDYINDKYRYCLWLEEIPSREYLKIPEIKRRLDNVAEMRQKSPTKYVNEAAYTPNLFTETRQPNEDYLIIPSTSSENRKYIPIGLVNKDIIASNATQIISTSDKYIFGILTSNVHNAWMRVICGMLKSDYRYSPFIYNNFPWPVDIDSSKKEKIIMYANKILDVRNKYENWSLAELYNSLSMPKDLLDVHRQLDRAVWELYGKAWDITSEMDCVAHLMKLLTS